MNITSAISYATSQVTYSGLGRASSSTSEAVGVQHQAATTPGSSSSDANSIDPANGSQTEQNTPEQETQGQNAAAGESELTIEERQFVAELKQTDTKVRSHEMAHIAAGGSLITSGAQFSYKTGPDGQQYAVAGEVGIDTSAIPGDPEATIQKMNQVKQAALAPADPSGQDLKVAAQAASSAVKAMGELTVLMAKQQAAQNEDKVSASASQASQAYSQVSTLPEANTHTFQLAV